MHPFPDDSTTHSQLRTFEHNRYYFGKLLDVFHFELEQNYLNGKRWLLNRLISGYGVLCGLDVLPGRDGQSVYVTSGVALDRGGHEIIVPRRSVPVTLPARPPAPEGSTPDSKKEDYVHLCISFLPCEAEPTPVHVDDCGQATNCTASAIQERYKLHIREGKAPDIACECSVPEVILNGRINYATLVERVTRHCPTVPADLCIPLANICLPAGGGPLAASNIDICVRPIVYTNDLLFDIILSLGGDAAALRPRGGKQ
jgi:hypothetical protein